MSEAYLGEIRLFAGNYAPQDWAICNGSTLQVNNYQALYALIGNTYGGTAPNTFAVPDMRGRLLVGTGSGTGLTPRILAATGGASQVQLALAEIPSHTHTMSASTSPATATIPSSTTGLAAVTGQDLLYTAATVPVTADGPIPLSQEGGGTAHTNQMPSMGITYIICLMGLYPQQAS
jgi:microcystin-dependent protein